MTMNAGDDALTEISGRLHAVDDSVFLTAFAVVIALPDTMRDKQPLLDMFRPRLRKIRPPRRINACRLFCMSFEGMIADNAVSVLMAERISREAIREVWADMNRIGRLEERYPADVVSSPRFWEDVTDALLQATAIKRPPAKVRQVNLMLRMAAHGQAIVKFTRDFNGRLSPTAIIEAAARIDRADEDLALVLIRAAGWSLNDVPGTFQAIRNAAGHAAGLARYAGMFSGVLAELALFPDSPEKPFQARIEGMENWIKAMEAGTLDRGAGRLLRQTLEAGAIRLSESAEDVLAEVTERFSCGDVLGVEPEVRSISNALDLMRRAGLQQQADTLGKALRLRLTACHEDASLRAKNQILRMCEIAFGPNVAMEMRRSRKIEANFSP